MMIALSQHIVVVEASVCQEQYAFGVINNRMTSVILDLSVCHAVAKTQCAQTCLNVLKHAQRILNA